MARLGRSIPQTPLPRLRHYPQVFLGSQPALGLGKLGVANTQPIFTPTMLSAVVSQVAFIRAAGADIIQQPIYLGGVTVSVAGTLHGYAYGLATLTAQQAAIGMTNTVFLAAVPAYTGGQAQAFAATLPAYGVVRSALLAAQPAHGSVRTQIANSQPAYAPVGAIWATQGMMVRSFPALTVTPNVVAQRSAPVQAVEITL